MSQNAVKTYRDMEVEAHKERADRMEARNAELRAQLDAAHTQLFGNNFWLLVIGVAIGVAATILAMNAFGGAA